MHLGTIDLPIVLYISHTYLLPPSTDPPVHIVQYFGYYLCECDQVLPRRLSAAANGSRKAVGASVPLHSHRLHGKEGGLEEVLLSELQQELAVMFGRDALVQCLSYWCTLPEHKSKDNTTSTRWNVRT